MSREAVLKDMVYLVNKHKDVYDVYSDDNRIMRMIGLCYLRNQDSTMARAYFTKAIMVSKSDFKSFVLFLASFLGGNLIEKLLFLKNKFFK